VAFSPRDLLPKTLTYRQFAPTWQGRGPDNPTGEHARRRFFAEDVATI